MEDGSIDVWNAVCFFHVMFVHCFIVHCPLSTVHCAVSKLPVHMKHNTWLFYFSPLHVGLN